MTPRRFLRFILIICLLGTVVWRYAPWPARTLVFKEQNCQCQIPYNWTISDKPDFVLEAHRPSGGTILIAAKPSLTSRQVDDPAFSQGIKDRVTGDGYEFLQENHDPFQGHNAYAYTMRKVINGYMIYVHSVSFIEGAFRYDLVLSEKDIDPSQDTQLQAAINSFSVLSAPVATP